MDSVTVWASRDDEGGLWVSLDGREYTRPYDYSPNPVRADLARIEEDYGPTIRVTVRDGGDTLPGHCARTLTVHHLDGTKTVTEV
jgi:hypothetical protein